MVSGASKMLLGFDLGHSAPLVCSKLLYSASHIFEGVVSLPPLSIPSGSICPLEISDPSSTGLESSSSVCEGKAKTEGD